MEAKSQIKKVSVNKFKRKFIYSKQSLLSRNKYSNEKQIKIHNSILI